MLALAPVLLALAASAAGTPLTKRDALVPRPRGSANNAARLAAGLPPLRPRRLFNPTKTSLAARALPSGAPGTAVNGLVALRDADGNTMGCLSAFNTYSAVCDESSATFAYQEPAAYGGAMQILLSDGTYWAAGANAATTITPTSGAYLNALSSTTDAPANSPPTLDQSSNSYVEDAIFTIDPDSGALSATWTNPDMTYSPLVAVVDGPNFFWVGNVADYNAASGADAMPVTLVFQQ